MAGIGLWDGGGVINGLVLREEGTGKEFYDGERRECITANV